MIVLFSDYQDVAPSCCTFSTLLGPQVNAIFFWCWKIGNFHIFKVHNGNSVEAGLPRVHALGLLLSRRLLPPPLRPRHHQPPHIHHYEQALQVNYTLWLSISSGHPCFEDVVVLIHIICWFLVIHMYWSKMIQYWSNMIQYVDAILNTAAMWNNMLV